MPPSVLPEIYGSQMYFTLLLLFFMVGSKIARRLGVLDRRRHWPLELGRVNRDVRLDRHQFRS
jgi:hypothetical protein